MRRRGCWATGPRSDSHDCCPDASQAAQPSWGTRAPPRFSARSAAKVDLVGAHGEPRSGAVYQGPPRSREAATSCRHATKTGRTSSANMATVIRRADSPLGPRTNKMADCCFRRLHETYVVLPALGVDALIAGPRPWRIALHAEARSAPASPACFRQERPGSVICGWTKGPVIPRSTDPASWLHVQRGRKPSHPEDPPAGPSVGRLPAALRGGNGHIPVVTLTNRTEISRVHLKRPLPPATAQAFSPSRYGREQAVSSLRPC